MGSEPRLQRLRGAGPPSVLRGIAKLVIAAMAGLVVFAALLALCDTK